MLDNTEKFWRVFWPIILGLSGLVIVFLIVLQRISLDPYFYPILGMMLGFPLVPLLKSVLNGPDQNNNTQNKDGSSK